MNDLLEFYVRAFSVILPLFAMVILMIGATRAKLLPEQIAAAAITAALVFGLWHAAVVPASQAGWFNVPTTPADPPVVFGFLIGGAALLWALAWLTPLGRRISMATPLGTLAAFQIPRLMGGVFLIGWLVGDIPAAFAIPAGLGDIWAGIAGWQASRALWQNAPDARRLLKRANVIGIGDFILAVLLGILTSEGFAHLISREAPNIINDHPLALFPAYFVPIFLGFHLITMSRMRAEHATAPESLTEPPAI